MRLLAHDALVQAQRVYGLVRIADELARGNHHAKARSALAKVAAICASELPVLNAVIAAQAKAAEGLNLNQLPGRVQPEPHPHANDHVPTPEKPAPGVA